NQQPKGKDKDRHEPNALPEEGTKPVTASVTLWPSIWPSVTTPWRRGALHDRGKDHPGGGEHPLRTDADFCVNELFRLRTKLDKPPFLKLHRIDMSSST